MTDELLTVKEAAERYEVPLATLRKWVRQGRVSHVFSDEKNLAPSGKLSPYKPAKWEEWKRRAAVVYFVKCDKFVKIGISADMELRLQNISALNPLPLEVLGVIPCVTVDVAREIESELHSRFRGARHQGEWFRDSRGLRAYIAGATEPWTPKE